MNGVKRLVGKPDDLSRARLARPAIDRRAVGWHYGPLGMASPPIDRIITHRQTLAETGTTRLDETMVWSATTEMKPLPARQPRSKTTVRPMSAQTYHQDEGGERRIANYRGII